MEYGLSSYDAQKIEHDLGDFEVVTWTKFRGNEESKTWTTLARPTRKLNILRTFFRTKAQNTLG